MKNQSNASENNNIKMSQLQRQVADLRKEISPTPSYQGGMMTTSNRTVFLSGKVTKRFASGNLGLNDIGDFNNDTTIVTRVTVTFPPYLGGQVNWLPQALMPETIGSAQSDRIVIPRHTQQHIVLDVPDAHQQRLTGTKETDKFVQLTVINSLSSSDSSPQAYVTVFYKTKVTVNL